MFSFVLWQFLLHRNGRFQLNKNINTKLFQLFPSLFRRVCAIRWLFSNLFRFIFDRLVSLKSHVTVGLFNRWKQKKIRSSKFILNHRHHPTSKQRIQWSIYHFKRLSNFSFVFSDRLTMLMKNVVFFFWIISSVNE